MRIVLRNCKTNLFVRGFDDWTSDVSNARDFESTDCASTFVTARRLEDMRIVLRLGAACPSPDAEVIETLAAA